MPPSRPGDWLREHGEAGQSFAEYRLARPRPVDEGRKTIYVLPIGDFHGRVDSALLQSLREYLTICFQRPVSLLPALPERRIPDSLRRTGGDGSVQLHSGFMVAELLPPLLSADGIALMAVAQKDLYPGADWNYVFGQASYGKFVGMASLYRLKGLPGDSVAQRRCLERLLKTASHEIGHMLGLAHCIDADCLMNGSNNLPEADRQPLRPCSQCQRKLHFCLAYDPVKRVGELQDFLERSNLLTAAEDNEKDLHCIQSAANNGRLTVK